MSPILKKKYRNELSAVAQSLGGTLGDTEDFIDSRDHIARLIASETAPEVTHREWLARHGLRFPALGELSPEQITDELSRLIKALAFARVFIDSTDHLSDRQLYEKLTTDILEGKEPDVPRMENEAFHWSLDESGNPQSEVWLSYYASEEDREELAEAFPDQPLPPQQKLPFNRDHTLPKP